VLGKTALSEFFGRPNNFGSPLPVPKRTALSGVYRNPALKLIDGKHPAVALPCRYFKS
jgi:hypothetical protein